MSKHTPGPWYAQIDQTYGWPAKPTPNIAIQPVVMGRPINLPIAKVPRRNEESVTNALLMAASPELLNALTLCQRQLRGLSFTDSGIAHALESASSAISKATGEAA